VFGNCDSRWDNSYIHLFIILLENRKLDVSSITRWNNIKLDKFNVLHTIILYTLLYSVFARIYIHVAAAYVSNLSYRIL